MFYILSTILLSNLYMILSCMPYISSADNRTSDIHSHILTCQAVDGDANGVSRRKRRLRRRRADLTEVSEHHAAPIILFRKSKRSCKRECAGYRFPYIPLLHTKYHTAIWPPYKLKSSALHCNTRKEGSCIPVWGISSDA